MPHLVRGLRARKTMGSPHAPENPTPTPAVNLRVDIDGRAHGLEGKGSLFVDKDEKQPKQFAGDASGRGDDCRQEGVAHAWSSVTLPIFMMIQPSPLPAERARGQSQDGAGCHSPRGYQRLTSVNT